MLLINDYDVWTKKLFCIQLASFFIILPVRSFLIHLFWQLLASASILLCFFVLARQLIDTFILLLTLMMTGAPVEILEILI